MNHPQPHPAKAIVFAYFARQATPLERKAIETWLTTGEGNALYFTYLDEWERQHPQFYPDTDAARLRFTQFRQAPYQHQIPAITPPQSVVEPAEREPTHWLISRWFIGLAASVLLLIGLWLTVDYWYYTTQTNGYRQIRSLSLPDGSGVLLGANSSVRYARFGFAQGVRRVWLSGEAEFNVIHEPDSQRFTVETPDHTVVEVLGTVFVVNSRRNTTRVALKTGHIRLTTRRTTQTLLLSPGDVVTVSAQGHLKKLLPAVASAHVTWLDHRFVFTDTPLTDVANQLHDTFGVTVQIPQADLMARTVSGTFQAETADDLLQALTLMMNLRIDQSETGYILTPLAD